jgi:putative ABC transport system permease protein
VRIRTIVWRELFERKNQLVTSFLAILVGITAIVSIKNVTFFSEKAVAKELDALGANILILPKSASLQDYYSADLQEEEFPEEYVTRLTTSDLQGLDNLSPKLSLQTEVEGKRVTLTGILPKSEFQAKAAWLGAGIFSRPQGCGVVTAAPGAVAPQAQDTLTQGGCGVTTAQGAGNPPAKETLVRKRVIDSLGSSEALVGPDVAASLGLKQGDSVKLLGKPFTVTAILPQTGTIDDSRVFVHLHTLQQMTGKGYVLNAIEIVGCCNQISKGLVQKINKLLPEAKVVTIAQVVDTQIKTNRIMSRLSLIFLVIIFLVGGVSIANYMYANVFERRREIGTLMALGAGSSLILRMFVLKACLLGLTGGICGYALGTVLAVTLGPRLAGIPVLPMPVLLAWAVGLSLAVALAGSYFPARRAAHLDPCATLQEV